MRKRDHLVAALIGIGTLAACSSASRAQTAAASYPERAPLNEYLMGSSAETALAISAAPRAIADKADVMVLGPTGYRTVVKGTNGFVCMVWRSWSDDLADEQFWNPKVRAPICLNPIAVKTVLPGYFLRTKWVFSGLDRAQMQTKFAVAAAQGQLQAPGPGAMSYMMSRVGYLADGVGHAAPHIMFFVPRKDQQNWGADAPGSPISSAEGTPDPVALFFVSVAHWSDGTAAMTH